MKTNWTFEYIRKLNKSDRAVCEWVLEKEKEMEARTGVPWSCSPNYYKHTFRPWLDFKSVSGYTSAEESEAFLAELGDRDYVSFAQVHVSTGWPLPDVMRIAKSLSSAGLLVFNVDRMGKCCFVRKRRIGE